MNQHDLTPFQVFLAAAVISSFGGLAALLRSNQQLTARSIISAVLHSGTMGLIIALLWFNYYGEKDNVYFLLGVSGLAGIGGVTILDFLLQALKKGGINITIRPKDAPDGKGDGM